MCGRKSCRSLGRSPEAEGKCKGPGATLCLVMSSGNGITEEGAGTERGKVV